MAEKKGRAPVTIYGRWVYARLREENITLEELGKRINVQPQNLSNYFRGRRQSFGYRAKIETVLGEPSTDIKYSPDEIAV